MWVVVVLITGTGSFFPDFHPPTKKPKKNQKYMYCSMTRDDNFNSVFNFICIRTVSSLCNLFLHNENNVNLKRMRRKASGMTVALPETYYELSLLDLPDSLTKTVLGKPFLR